jgi:glutamate N-acetyltransferase / amino-acid N-acetyltransferase
MRWIDGGVTAPLGFTAGVAAAGLRRGGGDDIALVASERDCAAAGLFTRNLVKAAPVLLDMELLAAKNGNLGHLGHLGNLGRPASQFRAVVANAGNANACTGEAGMAAARGMQQAAANALGVQPEQVLVLSTGVIGVPLPVEQVAAGIHEAAAGLDRACGAAAARAMMTTDTVPKTFAVRVQLPGGAVTLGGMAKGAGMIHPDMATMLAVLATDAAVEPGLLARLLKEAADGSFNCISVDGDTSTNDTVLLLANSASGVAVDGPEAEAAFAEALLALSTALAQAIVRDGEGASRFVTVVVEGLAGDAAAKQVANTIATSPLVKTALAGGDPNWGRVLAAAGRAGVAFAPDGASLWIGPVAGGELQLVEGGTPLDYVEDEAAAIFAGAEVSVRLRLGEGPGRAVVWTTDLTHAYVTINSHYRT